MTRSRLIVWAPWLLVLVVLGVGLAIGAGVGGSPSIDDRTRAIASEIRCPSCSDLNAAQSNDVTAVAVRNLIHQRLEQGQSEAEIDAYLVSRYGPDILLRPSGRGISSLVWILPVVVALLALAAVAWALARWRATAGSSSEIVEPDGEARRRVDEALERAVSGGGGGPPP